ncbi:MAG: c-type cytochrome [Myxococcaceae bacterium]|nr:c-type cytochrome [Myxococcaceae bacterium]
MKLMWLMVGSLVASAAVANPSPELASQKELKKVMALKGDPVNGKDRYQAACASCHLDNGAGQPDGTFPQLAGQHPVVVLKQMTDIRAGARENAVMLGAAKAVSEQDLADIALYLKLLPIPHDNGRGEGEFLDDGLVLYKRDCLSCHGRSGEGDPKTNTPVLAGQHYKYLLRQAMDIRDGKRLNSNPKMMEAIKGYTDTQVIAVTDFMSRLVMPELPKKKK